MVAKKKKNTRTKKVIRPPRVYTAKNGRKYIQVKGKRFYIDNRKNLSDNKLVNKIIVNLGKNFAPQKRRKRSVGQKTQQIKQPFIRNLERTLYAFDFNRHDPTILNAIRENTNKINELNRLQPSLERVQIRERIRDDPELQRQKDELEEQNRIINEEKERLQEERENLGQQNESLQKDIEEREIALNQAQDHFERELIGKDEEMADLEQRFRNDFQSEVEKQNNALNIIKTDAKKEVKEKEKIIRENQRLLEEEQRKNAENEKQLEIEFNSRQELSQRNEQLQKNVEELSKQVVQTEQLEDEINKLKQFEDLSKQQENQLSNLTNQLNNLQTSIQKHIDENEELNQQKNALEQQLESSENISKKEAEESKRNLKKVATAIPKLKKQIENDQKKYSDLEEAFNEQVKFNEEAKKHIISLQQNQPPTKKSKKSKKSKLQIIEEPEDPTSDDLDLIFTDIKKEDPDFFKETESSKQKKDAGKRKKREVDEKRKQKEKQFVGSIISGAGASKGGLYDYEIEEIMAPYRKRGFLGVISADQIPSLYDLVGNKKKVSFIMNLDKSNKSGSHWVACYINTKNDMSVEYYDSYGKPPTKLFMKDIKKLIELMDPDVYLKFKINKIIEQRADTNTCGWFAISFLMDRMDGLPFKECTGYSDTKNGEKKAAALKKEFPLI